MEFNNVAELFLFAHLNLLNIRNHTSSCPKSPFRISLFFVKAKQPKLRQYQNKGGGGILIINVIYWGGTFYSKIVSKNYIKVLHQPPLREFWVELKKKKKTG